MRERRRERIRRGEKEGRKEEEGRETGRKGGREKGGKKEGGEREEGREREGWREKGKEKAEGRNRVERKLTPCPILQGKKELRLMLVSRTHRAGLPEAVPHPVLTAVGGVSTAWAQLEWSWDK